MWGFRSIPIVFIRMGRNFLKMIIFIASLKKRYDFSHKKITKQDL